MTTPESTGKHRAPSERRSDEVALDGAQEKTSQTPAEIEAEIEQQREELAETLDALSAKLDVKAQAQAKAHDVKETAQLRVVEAKQHATTDDGKPRPELVAAVVVVVAGTVAFVWWRRSR
jgi:thioesterase domain-containing protein